ncbi:outer membrane efflux protein [Candidatus Magnetominusculus xianensis]|uniref:Outer membrane efflux protein n=2 Tax=Candidatus Magnetominusculus xianensis TaxID=1748249 RepID=A0ABR5SH55_9BACT|nr:outer membrane efflux protein [Candidatus Magnetominusculus xianensis]
MMTVFVSAVGMKNASADDLDLDKLIVEAVTGNHEVIAAESKAATSEFRIPQAASPPDPMFTIGYQNEGFQQYTFGQEQGAQWIVGLTQTFPFPGKLALKEQAAAKETDSLRAIVEDVRLKTVARVKELYFDLLLSHKTIEIIKERAALFEAFTDAALARYSSGMAQQEDVLMAQKEKYMLIEKEEIEKQKIQTLSGDLNTTLGRDVNSPLGRPSLRPKTPYTMTLEGTIRRAYEASPAIRAKEELLAQAKIKIDSAKKDFYPDIAINAGYYQRSGDFKDMWSLTASFPIPIFYKGKQNMAVSEAASMATEAIHELDSAKAMRAASVRENYTLIQSSEKLMGLYKDALIPRMWQDYELAVTGYINGKVDALTVVTRLKSLLDYELEYWGQYTAREKAVARLEALTAPSVKGE